MRDLAHRIVACTAIFLLIGTGLRGQQSATVAESDAYRVEFLETVDVSGTRADIRHDFAVTPKSGADPFRLSTNQSWEFSSIEFAGRLLLVHGALGGNALTTAIVDLDKKETVDSIIHWGAKPSPDGRFLAIQLHYPRLGSLETRSSVLSIYDFTLSSDDNRLKPNSDNGIVRSMRVGVPVYPLENADPPTYNVWVEDRAKVHFIRDIGWLSDRLLIFRDGSEEVDSIINVDLTNGQIEARVTAANIPDSLELPQIPNWRELIDFVDEEVLSLRTAEGQVTLSLTPLADYRRPQP